MSERVQIFSEGSFTAGDLTWGWQCFICRDEETGFGSATTAGEGRDNHAAVCPGSPQTPLPGHAVSAASTSAPLTAGDPARTQPPAGQGHPTTQDGAQ